MMKPEIYWIEKALWRPVGSAAHEELSLRRGRLRVMKPDSIAYFYIEDRAQMDAIYSVWESRKRIELQIQLEDVEEPQTITGMPKPETPPYENPPYHFKIQFETAVLTMPLQANE